MFLGKVIDPSKVGWRRLDDSAVTLDGLNQDSRCLLSRQVSFKRLLKGRKHPVHKLVLTLVRQPVPR